MPSTLKARAQNTSVCEHIHDFARSRGNIDTELGEEASIPKILNNLNYSSVSLSAYLSYVVYLVIVVKSLHDKEKEEGEGEARPVNGSAT